MSEAAQPAQPEQPIVVRNRHDPAQRPIILEMSLVNKYIADPELFVQFPVFASVLELKRSLAAHDNSGCSSCRKHKNATSVYNAFLRVLESADADFIASFKAYVKIEKLIITRNGQIVTL